MNADQRLLGELSEIIGHTTKTAALHAPAKAAHVAEEAHEDVEKVASIGAMPLPEILEHPAFLKGVHDSIVKHAHAIDQALCAAYEAAQEDLRGKPDAPEALGFLGLLDKVAKFNPKLGKNVPMNPTQFANTIAGAKRYDKVQVKSNHPLAKDGVEMVATPVGPRFDASTEGSRRAATDAAYALRIKRLEGLAAAGRATPGYRPTGAAGAGAGAADDAAAGGGFVSFVKKHPFLTTGGAALGYGMIKGRNKQPY